MSRRRETPSIDYAKQLIKAGRIGDTKQFDKYISKCDLNVKPSFEDDIFQVPILSIVSSTDPSLTQQSCSYIIRRLVEEKADISCTNSYSRSALTVAVINKSHYYTQALLESRADVDTVSMYDGKTALHHACELEDECIGLSLLNYHAKFDILDATGVSALHKACIYNQPNILRTLITLNADVNQTGRNGFTGLHFACMGNHLEIINILITLGQCDLYLDDIYGNSSFYYACEFSDKPVLSYLISSNVDINARFNNGFTALHQSVSNIKEHVLIDLISLKADVNSLDNRGQTPLFEAIMQNNKEAVRTLICSKADVNLKNNDNNSVLYMASSDNTNKSIVTALIESQADVNTRCINDKTPLFNAVNHNCIDIVMTLISAHADVYTLDGNRENILHIASKDGYQGLLDLLISYAIQMK